MTATRSAATPVDRRIWRVAMVGLATVLLAPLLAARVPPLLDYPNHLARMVVLADAGHVPALARMYEPHWTLLPNLATDLLGVALLRAGLPPFLVGKLLLAVVILFPVAGTLAYHRALFGPRRPWALGVGLVACNGLFLLGFLNFIVSLGVALLVAASWARHRETRPGLAVAIATPGAVAVFFCHLGGVLFLLVLLTAQEAEAMLPAWRARRTLMPVLRRAAIPAAALLPVVALYRITAVHDAASPVLWRPFGDKVAVLFTPVLNYVPVLDFATAALLLSGLVLAGRRGWLAMPNRTAIGLAVLLLIYAAMPNGLKGGFWADARFPVMAGYLLFAGLDLRVPPGRPARLLVLALVALLGTRQAVLASVWHESDRDVAELERAIAPVRPGERVLVLRASRSLHPRFWHGPAPRSRDIDHLMNSEFHLAALLPIERHAFWPLLFAIPSQQPLLVRPPFRAISAPGTTPPDFLELERPLTARERAEAPYLAGWRRHFDRVLVLDAEDLPDPARFRPDALRLVDDTGFAALYAVRPAPDAPPPAALDAAAPSGDPVPNR